MSFCAAWESSVFNSLSSLQNCLNWSQKSHVLVFPVMKFQPSISWNEKIFEIEEVKSVISELDSKISTRFLCSIVLWLWWERRVGGLHFLVDLIWASILTTDTHEIEILIKIVQTRRGQTKEKSWVHVRYLVFRRDFYRWKCTEFQLQFLQINKNVVGKSEIVPGFYCLFSNMNSF